MFLRFQVIRKLVAIRTWRHQALRKSSPFDTCMVEVSPARWKRQKLISPLKRNKQLGPIIPPIWPMVGKILERVIYKTLHSTIECRMPCQRNRLVFGNPTHKLKTRSNKRFAVVTWDITTALNSASWEWIRRSLTEVTYRKWQKENRTQSKQKCHRA